MKKYFLLSISAVALAGCAHNSYDITTTSGAKLTGVSKPVLHQETDEYYFTDAQGKKMAIKSIRVRVIEPHEENKFKNKSESGFNTSSGR